MKSNIKTIAKNTGWYGLETLIDAVLTTFTSIAVARTLGPTKMGYIIYAIWFVSVVSGLGGLGLPATTRKYMAEFLGMGDKGTARYIYIRTLLLQVGLATIATAGLVFWVFHDVPAGYKLASLFIVLSVWPSMVNTISAQANVASEELSKNLPASALSMSTYFLMILATLLLHWGVEGVGASMLAMRIVDFSVRFVPTIRNILGWESTHAHPQGLRDRMVSFAWQSVAVMIVEMIVWQRVEVVLLKHLCADIRQLTYYSIAFSVAERLLISATIFGSAAGATVFAQYGRDKSRVPEITASTFRYLALTSIPLHFIAAALAAPALILVYGKAYVGAAAVVTLAPLFCLPKAFIAPIQSLLQSHERQKYIIAITVLAGVIDIGVAWLLIPAYGAVGACIGSGAAEITAISLMWAIGIYQYQVKLPWLLVSKVTFISVLSSLTAYYINVRLAPVWGILCGGTAALVVLVSLFYLLRVLKPEDHARFNTMTGILPKPISIPLNKLITLLVRPAFAG